MTPDQPPRTAGREDETGAPESLTRGFLFADLRGYTSFVEARGASAAAELLNRYRLVVRDAVASHRGAEIKTEGDSFFVVFSSVSGAVECGLAIQAAAASASEAEPEAPIRVGIGIHAGETVEADGGYVGSAVNMAARLCSSAEPDEVLVSDTVRALVSNTLAVRFALIGRRRLKGIADPVSVYRAVSTGAAFGSGRAGRSRGVSAAMVATGAVVLVAAVAAAFVSLRPDADGTATAPSGSDAALSSASAGAQVNVIAVPTIDPEAGIVGVVLQPGVHRFEKLAPSITFEVPDASWMAYRDYVDAAGLQLLTPRTELPIGWLDFGQIQVVYDGGCLDDDTLVLGSSPSAVAEWLQGHPGLEASTPVPVNIGGYSGLRVDATTRSADEDTCAADQGAPATWLFPLGQDFYHVFPEESLSVITVDVDGRAFSILLNAPTEDFETFMQAATPILDSLAIEN